MNVVTTLVIEANGRYRWDGTIAVTVAGQAVASEKTTAGAVSTTGATILFTPDTGAPTSHTFLAVAGTPLTAVSIDSNMFARVD